MKPERLVACGPTSGSREPVADRGPWRQPCALALLVLAPPLIACVVVAGRSTPTGKPRLARGEALALLDAYVARQGAAPGVVASPVEGPARGRRSVRVAYVTYCCGGAAPVAPAPTDLRCRGAAYYRRGLAQFQLGGVAAAIDDLGAAEAWFAAHLPEYVPVVRSALERALAEDPGWRRAASGSRSTPPDDWGLDTGYPVRP